MLLHFKSLNQFCKRTGLAKSTTHRALSRKPTLEPRLRIEAAFKPFDVEIDWDPDSIEAAESKPAPPKLAVVERLQLTRARVDNVYVEDVVDRMMALDAYLDARRDEMHPSEYSRSKTAVNKVLLSAAQVQDIARGKDRSNLPDRVELELYTPEEG